LIVLLGVFALASAVRLVLAPRWLDSSRCGRIALSAMLLLTGPSHFFMTADMVEMLPPWVPSRVAIVYATGVLEIMAAAGLLIARTARLTGWCLVAFFATVLPANVYAALHHTGVGGHGPGYLWFRVPLQAAFILWAWWFTRSPAT
jgi:uncharacterized membrane protein